MILITSFAFSQVEICDDGIDNDGDGLIDLNDTTDCQCSVQGGSIIVPSIIPNPSFEDHSCCPSTFGMGQIDDGLGCADDWMQAGGATSDYFHECGWNGATNSLPFPDGSGAVGMFSMQGWCEFVGGCLLSTTQAGEDYQITFSLGFDNMTYNVLSCDSPTETSPPINFTLYGTPNCNDIPFAGSSCPIGQGSWIELGYVTIDPMTIFHSWEEVTICFNTSIDIAGFALGPPCDLPSTGYDGYTSDCAPFFLIDNLIMNETVAFDSNLITDTIGSPCTNLTINAYVDTVGTLQWYYEGVAMVGETDSILDITGNNYPAGTYQVVFNYGADCLVGEESFVATPATIVASNDIAICVGQTVTLTASGGSTYYWDQDLGAGASHTVTPTTTTTYTVVGTNIHGCSDSDVVIVTVSPNPVPDITGLSSACNGESINLDAGLFSHYVWSTNETTQTITTSSSGNYTVTVTNEGGCTGSASHSVSISNEIILSFIHTNIVCYGETNGVASVIATGGIDPYTYLWSNEETNMQIDSLEASNYIVTVTDFNNCTATSNLIIIEPNAPLAMLHTMSNVTCYGGNNAYIHAQVQGGYPTYEYLWQNESMYYYTATINNIYAGTYFLSVTDANNCIYDTIINVLEPAQVVVEYTVTNPSCIGNNNGEINVIVIGGSAPYLYNWYGDDTPNAYLTGLTEGAYSLTVTDANSCPYEVNSIVLIDNNEDCIKIPNAYTPNGDGINDTWIIENIDMFPSSVIQVFNRWGQEIFIARGVDDPWDGTYNNKFVPAGSYVYVVDIFVESQNRVGIVTVIY